MSGERKGSVEVAQAFRIANKINTLLNAVWSVSTVPLRCREGPGEGVPGMRAESRPGLVAFGGDWAGLAPTP